MLVDVDKRSLNIVYNLEDFINKIFFGLITRGMALKESA